MNITGTIESIEYRISSGYEKKVVTIVPDHRQRAFVEFRGKIMEYLNDFKEGEEITVSVTLEGKVSKNSGIQYNNLVAKHIKPFVK